jgi:PhoH-like ATPase
MKELSLNSGGTIIVKTNVMKDSYFSELFWEDNPDHRILALAYNLSKDFPNRVVLVTKDINLRMKSKSIGINAEDYETGKIKNIDDLYSGKNLM